MQRLSGIKRYILYTSLFCLLQTGLVFAKGIPVYHLYAAEFISGDIIIIDSADQKEIGRIKMGLGANPVEIIPSPDKRLLYVTNRGFDEVAVIDIKSRNIKSRIKMAQGAHPHNMRFSPDGRYLVVGHNQDEYASIIDTASNKVIGTPRITDSNSGASGVAVTPDGRFAYITAIYRKEISIIDLKRMERVSTIKNLQGCAAIVIEPRSGLAYFSSNANRVSILDIKTNKIVGHVMVGDMPNYITLSMDGRVAFVTNYWSHSVSVIDLKARRILKEIKTGQEPVSSALSPDGRLLFVVNYGSGYKGGSISIIDVKVLKKIGGIKSLSYPRAVAVVPAA